MIALHPHHRIQIRIGICVLGLALVFGLVQFAWAISSESKFDSAQRNASKLRENVQHQKYRDRWLKCIEQFLEIERLEPQGTWTAASLYNAGLLYSELYRHSWAKSDKQAALDLMDKVAANFPDSRYTPKALELKKKLGPGEPNVSVTDGPVAKTKPSKIKTAAPKAKATPQNIPAEAQKWFDRARYRFEQVQKDPEKQKFRDHWIACISSYQKAYQADPKGPLAAPSLFGIASCYQGMHKWSCMAKDQQEGEKVVEKLLVQFPDSTYAHQARAMFHHDVAVEEGKKVAEDISQAMASSKITAESAVTDVCQATAQKPAVVNGLQFWSNPRYTRVVINADLNTEFTYRELREDPALGKPPRIYVDLHNSRLSKTLQKVVPINDNLLSDARAGQYSEDTVRVVVDTKSAKTFKIFSLKNPFRIVLDVWGVADKEPAVVANKEEASSNTIETEPIKKSRSTKIPPSAIVKQLALGVRRIVIDPGHGGRDFGAPGYLKGIHEKDVVLSIANRLARKIRSELQCEVVTTRKSDTYLSLEERMAIANTQNADLFISIHTNASPDSRAYGIETFILNLATDDESIRVAARENSTSMKNISDLDSILKDLMQNAKISESTRLAGYVQQAMTRQLAQKHDNIRSKGVKQAPFYVLLGAEMPSILIETSFISNERECRRLTNSDYQEQLCRGIVAGIRRYVEETNPVASWQSPNGQKKRADGG